LFGITPGVDGKVRTIIQSRATLVATGRVDFHVANGEFRSRTVRVFPARRSDTLTIFGMIFIHDAPSFPGILRAIIVRNAVGLTHGYFELVGSIGESTDGISGENAIFILQTSRGKTSTQVGGILRLSNAPLFLPKFRAVIVANTAILADGNIDVGAGNVLVSRTSRNSGIGAVLVLQTLRNYAITIGNRTPNVLIVFGTSIVILTGSNAVTSSIRPIISSVAGVTIADGEVRIQTIIIFVTNGRETSTRSIDVGRLRIVRFAEHIS